ncbi:helix-turn-helix transcriptional regulator [Cryobacterium sp. AP23]
MVSTDRQGARQVALASEPRRRVLGLLTAAGGPLDAVTVAAGMGLHVTTARFHLEQLEAVGLVERRINRAGGRGRPQVLFSPVAEPLPVEDAQQQLMQALAAVIGEDDDGGRARSVRAGERWSAQYSAAADAPSAEIPVTGGPVVLEPTADGPVAPDPTAEDTFAGAVVPTLLRVLTEIGFEPELDADEATIALPACPFRAEARQNPDVVCSVHLGLLKGVARSLGHNGDGIRLRPFVQPHLCLVELPHRLAN